MSYEDHERRIQALECQIAELKGQPIPARVAAVAPVQEGPRIFNPVPSVSMPTPSELEKLLDIVLRQFPALDPQFRGRFADTDRDDFVAGFRSASYAIQTWHRIDTPDMKRSVTSWIDLAEEIARLRGMSARIRLANFIAAVLAAGDIPHDFQGALSSSVHFGLAVGESAGSQRANLAAWRRVLAEGGNVIVKPTRSFAV